MRPLKLPSLLAAALAAGLAAAPAVPAAAAESSATASLRARDAEIRAALPEEGREVTPAHRKRIESIVTRAIDVPGMVETAMGRRWNEASAAQRKRLVAAFENRFRQTSGAELDAFRSTNIEYQPEVAGAGGAVQVPTKVVIKGEPTEITYAMAQAKDGWRITDIVIDGVSTVASYRSSFSRIIGKEGVEGLIKRLEKGSASSPGPSAASASKK